MSDDRENVMRVLTVELDNTDGVAEASKNVELCRGAHVYSYTFSGSVPSDVPEEDIPAELGTLRLQDSELRLVSYGCRVVSIRADLSPPPHFPASAKVIAPAGVHVALHLTYGHCVP